MKKVTQLLSKTVHMALHVIIATSMVFAPYMALPQVVHAGSSSHCASDVDVNAGDTVTWTANVAADGDDVMFSWSGSVTGSEQVVTQVYDSAGNKEATATVTAEGGDTDTTCSVSYVVTPGVVNEKPIIYVDIDPLTIEFNGPYDEFEGIRVEDTEDDLAGEIITPVVSGDSVDTSTSGSYTVVYNATDSDGLAADEVTRVVIVEEEVVENTKPVITLHGEVSVRTPQGYDYIDLGASVEDIEDDLAGHIIDITEVSTVDTDTIGTYTITFNAVDSEGLAADEVVRDVEVYNTAPVITVGDGNYWVNEPTVILYEGDTYNDADYGVTAEDAEDGDVTDQILVDAQNVNTNEVGNYIVYYSVKDINGAEGTAYRHVIVLAGEGDPVAICTISYEVSEGEVVNFSTPHIDGATYSWSGDDGLTGDMATISHTYTTSGTFSVSVTVAGVEDVSCEINTPPQITVVGDPLEIQKGGSYDPYEGVTATDAEDYPQGGFYPHEDIQVGGDTVDVNTSGDYTVTYDVIDSHGVSAETVSRIVRVSGGGGGGSCVAPAITSALEIEAVLDEEFTYLIEATGSSIDTATYTVENLPEGLSFDEDTQEIIGIPTALLEDHEVTITVETACNTVTETLVIDVVAPVCSAPELTSDTRMEFSQGQNMSYIFEHTGSDDVEVSIDDTLLPENLSFNDEGNGVYTITGTLAAANGEYTIPVTLATNTEGECGVTETEVTIVVSGGGGGGGGNPTPPGGGGGGGVVLLPPAQPAPAPEPIACHYLRDYLRVDFDNDFIEVLKLQAYLNNFEGEILALDGVFGLETQEAVERYQNKYADEILGPWGHEAATGYVYITTQKHINETYCQSAFPLTVLEQDEIDSFRTLLESLDIVGVPEGGLVDPLDIGNTEEDFVNDGVIGLNTDDTVIEVIPEPEPESETSEEEVDFEGDNPFVNNLATVLFAAPEGFNATAQCVGWFVIILLAVYIVGTLLVNRLSREDNISSRTMRMRKVVVYAIGLVYSLIPVLYFEQHCLVLPLCITLIILGIIFTTFWLKERRVRKVLGIM